MGATENIVLDRGVFGEVRLERGKYRLFRQRDDDFASFRCCGYHTATFSGSEEPSETGYRAKDPRNGKTAA